MRLKPFIAANMSEALQLVKESLGSDAIILNTEKLPDGQVKLTAAIDEEDFSFTPKEEVEKIPSKSVFDDSEIRESLNYHGVIETSKDKILSRIRKAHFQNGESDSLKLLAQDLNQNIGYYKMLDRSTPFKLFMGVSGSGKSTAIAKVATQAKFKKISACIISTDNIRAGANNQLESFAKILDTPFIFAGDANMLYNKAAQNAQKYNLVLIDTPGVNPFKKEEVDKLKPFINVLKADKIMTMDAGRNAYDAVEIAEVFKNIGAQHIFPTRLDLARRIGGIISVADVCKLKLGAAGISASIVQGIAKIDAASLAKLLLPKHKQEGK